MFKAIKEIWLRYKARKFRALIRGITKTRKVLRDKQGKFTLLAEKYETKLKQAQKEG